MQPQAIDIICGDKVVIKGSLFEPANPLGAIMIAPATGIKRGFYQSLAAYLADSGFAVVTFDNRGIGDSLEGPISKCSYDAGGH